MAAMSSHPGSRPTEQPLDIREKGGRREGVQQTCDRRLFMQLLAFGDCDDADAAARALQSAQLEGVVYADLNDPRGIAVLTLSERPDHLVTRARGVLAKPPFSGWRLKPELTMVGRTYAIGYEPELEDWLLHRPRRVVLGPDAVWGIWYPLRRQGAFEGLAPEERRQILGEHGRIGHRFGEAGHAQDIRLACFGLDRNDNDFVIGLIGKELHPLSACVEAMRSTRQTSQYMEKMGPFLVGRTVWQSPLRG